METTPEATVPAAITVTAATAPAEPAHIPSSTDATVPAELALIPPTIAAAAPQHSSPSATVQSAPVTRPSSSGGHVSLNHYLGAEGVGGQLSGGQRSVGQLSGGKVFRIVV